MKAIGLRFATGFAAVALFGGTLFLAAPTAQADPGQLKAALDDYAAGKLEDALKKLQEYVATNPGDDEVYGVLRAVDETVKLRALAAGGESERLMRYLLDKAKPVFEAKKRDPDRIKRLVEAALSGDIDARRKAGLELALSSGDYAVPYLYPHLADTDVEKLVNTIFAFHDIGSEAVLPLCEVMNSSDARLRKYVAALLGDLKDMRALPVLRRAVEKDADADVKAKAADSIRRIRPDGVAMTAAASYVKLGQMYYAGEPSVISELDQVHNVWKWEGDALVRYEVAAGLYNYDLAERNAAEAIALDAGFLPARSLLVRAILAQTIEGRAMGDKAPDALKGTGAWDLAASQGFDAASAALGEALAQRDWDVAVEACRLVAATYGGQDLAGTALGNALATAERRVQYAAAIAALRMSPSKPFANSQQVPALAAQAASETALRQVFVIDDQDAGRNRMLQDLREGGYVVADESDGYRGVVRLQAAPTCDVVIVRADLGAATALPSDKWKSTLAVIDELLADARTKNMRIVVVAGGADAEAKKAFLTAKYGDKIAGYIDEPLVATGYLPIVEAAVKKGELSKGGALALAVAAEAADAFSVANAGCSAWDFKVAIDPLANNADSGASDEVKMNSVRALGNLKAGGSAALATILKSADAKEELKVAAAKALGQVLSRNAAIGDEVDALVASAKAGGVVGAAAMGALGQVRGLSGDVIRALYGDHKFEVGKKGE